VLRSASASCSRLAPLAEDSRGGVAVASRSCSAGPGQGAVLARSLVIPEEGRARRPEPDAADAEFCQLLTAALAAPPDGEGYGLEASEPLQPEVRPATESRSDVGALQPDPEEPIGDTTMPPQLRELSSNQQAPPAKPLLTPLPLGSKAADSPRSPSCHPFGAQPRSEVTPRSMSCETREEAEAVKASALSPRPRKPRMAKRKDFQQVMEERRRLLDARGVVKIERP